MGSITGAAGGVIRDVFINEIPLIFRKEIYAMACVVGGIAYWLCDVAGLESYACQLIGGTGGIPDPHLSCQISHLPTYIKRYTVEEHSEE